ncbi:kelch-like protein 17 [Aplysia californica]|uniref:Kelch-like protein 17 n=1 Tax=Aplysia californica TaxID=6500 RepID=A0ABM0JSM8_APLCA|nr:kelch-like protein 17 [Aplysia californica]
MQHSPLKYCPPSLTFEEDGCKVKVEGNLMTITVKGQQAFKREMNEIKKTPFDITLQVGSADCQVKAHKEVLANKVDYFKAMFSENFAESSQSVVDLGEYVDFQTVSKLIEFFYKGIMHVAATDVQKMFQLSDIWSMSGIYAMCTRFMEWELDVSNCLDLLKLAKTHSCEKLGQACCQVIRLYFQAVVHTEAFLELSARDLVEVLREDGLRTGPRGEDFVLEAVLKWYKHDRDARVHDLEEVLGHVSVSEVSQDLRRQLLDDSDVEGKQELERRFQQQDTEVPRKCTHHFMIICGFLQSRTGPTCPRTPTVEKYDPGSDTLSTVCSLPEAPSYGVALNLMGYVTFFAVYMTVEPDRNDCSHTTVVYVYNHLFDKWDRDDRVFTEAARDGITRCLTHGGTVAHCTVNNVIYAVRVEESIAIDVKCQDGDILCDVKRPLPSLTTVLDASHCGLKAVVHKGQLFLLGGFSGPMWERVFSDAVLALSEDHTRWLTKSSMISTRCDFAVVSLGEEIFVSGGYGGENPRRRLQKCERYDVREDKWLMFAEMQHSRSHHCSLAMDGLLYTIGGKSYASQKHADLGGWYPGGARIVSNFVEVADPTVPTTDGDRWRRVASLCKSRCNFSAVVV